MSSSSPKSLPISIIIPSLDRGIYLAATIEALLAAPVLPLEIIVVDQTSEHPADVEARLAQLARQPLVRYFRVKERGASKARNFGLRLANGEITLFLDDDIELIDDLLQNHWRHYADPTVGSVTGAMLKPGGVPMTRTLPPEFFWPVVGFAFVPLDYFAPLENYNHSTCNGSVRTAIARRMGGFDEQYQRLEDTDFGHRLSLEGCRVLYDPAAAVVHLCAPTGALRAMLKPVAPRVLGGRAIWADTFYLVRKNFGWSGWRFAWWWARRWVVRRPLLSHPVDLARAFLELAAGWRIASRRLKEGPKYDAGGAQPVTLPQQKGA